MNMQSTNLLPALRELPGGEYARHMSFREMMVALLNTDRAMFAAEFASAVSFGTWGVFQGIIVDDNLAAAYEAQYPGLAADHSLHEHWQEMMDRGNLSMDKFVDGLKGKVAEFETKEMLESQGYTGVEIASDPTHEVWDISAIDPDGQGVLIQVKSVVEGSAGEVQGLMEANPDVLYYVSSEVYQKISDRAPDLVDRITDIGKTSELEGSVTEGLDLLSSNMGIDIPDGLEEIIPLAGAILAGARLAYSVIKTEKEFKAADRTTRNKIQVVQSLTVMSRYGVNTVLATVGGAGGTVAGSFMPGLGNLIGGIAGATSGVGIGMYLNRHLQPHMLSLALNITGLTHDDLFYYKNKPRIDEVAVSFQTTARELAAPPGF